MTWKIQRGKTDYKALSYFAQFREFAAEHSIKALSINSLFIYFDHIDFLFIQSPSESFIQIVRFVLSLCRSVSFIMASNLNASLPPLPFHLPQTHKGKKKLHIKVLGHLVPWLTPFCWSSFSGAFSVQAEPWVWDFYLLMMLYQCLAGSRGLGLRIIMGTLNNHRNSVN